MRRVFVFLVGFVLCVAGSASALSLRDLIELSRAGLGDDVLLALIDVDRPVFSIDAATLKSLKAAGVSERVIVAVVRSGRMPAAPVVAAAPDPLPEPPVAAPEPQVVVIDHHEPQVREVAVPYPVYVPVFPVAARRAHDVDDRVPGRDVSKAPEPKREPVYWGWGGKRRPDAWDETPRKRDAGKRDNEK
jgi:hypothetical protein